MRSKRLAQVEDLLRGVIAEELSRNWDFQGAIVSVTHVVVAPDLSRAKVLVSVLAGQGDEDRVWKRLLSGRRRLQKHVARETQLKRTPVLVLERDKSIEQGTRVLQIMKELEREEGRNTSEKEEEDAGESGRTEDSGDSHLDS